MPKDNLDLICQVARLATSLERTTSLTAFLDQVVRMVAEHMSATVCSLYLCDPKAQNLTLAATVGLAASAAGSVRLGLGEGIVGAAMAERRTIRVARQKGAVPAGSWSQRKPVSRHSGSQQPCRLRIPRTSSAAAGSRRSYSRCSWRRHHGL